ncbi:MAG: thiamine pyrophosphate-dependent dehydrogenase E1 component subunit alpha [Candidatus Marinimicrobia bacterium]|nr:thiamine pyrophosphate-dependent dehydrogenase E1 component subunit alpha [Candidatus Neomarinimicrobiota bacterium]
MEHTLKINLFKKLFKIRTVEETIADKYTEWEMRCPTHLSTGQEGVAAGVCQALEDDDFVFSSHRSHAHYIAKGGDIRKMIAEIYGKSTGCSAGRGGSMHLIDKSVGFLGSTSIVGGTIPLAAGVALSVKLKNSSQVTCTFFGDAAVEEGVFYETINYAVTNKLPVLFICENNLYSVYSPLSVRQPENRNIFEMVEGIGISVDHGNGNDPWEVFEKSRNAVGKIRELQIPIFLEFSTYRWREHCGPFFDNDIGYRTETEFLHWKEKDPLQFFENMLLEQRVIDESQIQSIKAGIIDEVNEAFQFAHDSDFPDFTGIQNSVYHS